MTHAAKPATSAAADDLRSLKIDTIDDLLSELAEFDEKASKGDVAVFKLMPITARLDLQDDRAVDQLEEVLDYLLAVVRNARNRVRTMKRRKSFPT